MLYRGNVFIQVFSGGAQEFKVVRQLVSHAHIQHRRNLHFVRQVLAFERRVILGDSGLVLGAYRRPGFLFAIIAGESGVVHLRAFIITVLIGAAHHQQVFKKAGFPLLLRDRIGFTHLDRQAGKVLESLADLGQGFGRRNISGSFKFGNIAVKFGAYSLGLFRQYNRLFP